MPLAYVFLTMLVAAAPVSIVLHAISLIVPLYLVLLVIGGLFIFLFFKKSSGFLSEEVFSLVALMIGAICLISGFALSPLVVQLLSATAIAIFYKVYWADVRVG